MIGSIVVFLCGLIFIMLMAGWKNSVNSSDGLSYTMFCYKFLIENLKSKCRFFSLLDYNDPKAKFLCCIIIFIIWY